VSDFRFEPVNRRTVPEEIREAISERVRLGVLAPGSQLPAERDLCEQFGVARTSVREAIQGLVSLGVLERRGNRTYVVEYLPDVQFDGTDGRKRRVHELFEVRQVVEVPIVRFAACRATNDDREFLTDIAHQFNAKMELEDFRRLDREFHSAIATSCGNATLAEVHGKVMESLFRSEELDTLLDAQPNRVAVREIIRDATDMHRRIALAISEGDWAAAMECAESHLDQVENQMISKMV
jgi:GntR family transcriptional repressor for pyruvate dehydrogenase complex